MEVIVKIDFAASNGLEIVAHAEKVSELVRCKDCKHYIENMGMCVFDAEFDNGEWYGFVSHHSESYFCADGERGCKQ